MGGEDARRNRRNSQKIFPPASKMLQNGIPARRFAGRPPGVPPRRGGKTARSKAGAKFFRERDFSFLPKYCKQYENPFTTLPRAAYSIVEVLRDGSVGAVWLFGGLWGGVGGLVPGGLSSSGVPGDGGLGGRSGVRPPLGLASGAGDGPPAASLGRLSPAGGGPGGLGGERGGILRPGGASRPAEGGGRETWRTRRWRSCRAR